MKLTAAERAIVNQAKKILRENLTPYGEQFICPDTTKNYLTLKLAHLEREEFHVLMLSKNHELIEDWRASTGTIDSAAVYPREIIKKALSVNAAAMILAHNHPSGNAEPSSADRAITKVIVEAAQLLDLRVLDHVIIGQLNSVSFAERGLI